MLLLFCRYKNCELTVTNYRCKSIKVVLGLLMNKTRLNFVTFRNIRYKYVRSNNKDNRLTSSDDSSLTTFHWQQAIHQCKKLVFYLQGYCFALLDVVLGHLLLNPSYLGISQYSIMLNNWWFWWLLIDLQLSQQNFLRQITK